MIYMRQEVPEGIRRHVQSLEGLEHVRILEIVPNHAKTAWDVYPFALNLCGNLCDGLIFALCDTITGMAIYVYEVSNVTQQGRIHFIESVSSGKLCAWADAVHKRSRTVIHHVGVTTSKGKVVADAIFIMFLFDPVQVLSRDNLR